VPPAPGRGFRIVGARPGDAAGAAVAPAGDVDGDGLGDILIVAPGAEKLTRPIPGRREIRRGISGAVYLVYGARDGAVAAQVAGVRPAMAVVYGGSRLARIDLDRPHPRVMLARGSSGDLGLGSRLAPAGDFDGDGLSDVLIAVPNSLGRALHDDDREPLGPGGAYILFGAKSRSAVDLTRRPGRALRISPPDRTLLFGYSAAYVGDANGDGRPEVALGAIARALPADPARWGMTAGAAWIVPGRPGRADVDLGRDASLRVDGQPDWGVGLALGGAGDVDADGLADLLVGAPASIDAYEAGTDEPGRVLLVHGRRELRGSAGGDVVWTGTPGDLAGAHLPGAADFDGDGRAEVLVGAPNTCAGSVTGSFAGHAGAEEVTVSRLFVLDPARRDVSSYGGIDALDGGTGADDLRGGPGGDRIQDGDGDASEDPGGELRGHADRLIGGPGNDNLFATAGHDVLDGGPGRDDISAGVGRDRIDGGAGDDLIGPGRGRDVVRAGRGNDRIAVRDGSRDVVDCGPGYDVVLADAIDRLRGCERRARPQPGVSDDFFLIPPRARR